MQILRAADRAATPWRNGGGVTWQVAGSPAGAGTANFDWRISIAEIAEDGEFSSYPGVHRVIAVIDGPGVELDVAGDRTILAPYEPFHFAGGAQTAGRLLGGPSRDLNLMVRAPQPRGSIEFSTIGTEAVVVDDDFVVVVAGTAHAGPELLNRYDAVRITAPLHVTGPGAVLALIRVA